LKKKYFIQTFGCQMNVRESEQIAVLLDNAGHECTDHVGSADYVILNTCSVREKAAQKVYSQLGRLKDLKKNNPRLIIGVGGCLAQQWGGDFLKKAPHLDMVVGTRNLHRFPDLINIVETAHSQVVETESCEANTLSENYIPAIPRKGQVSAFVSIMQGCDNFCSYCIVPFLRGREKSREPTDIIAEVEQLASHGIKEVTLLGQNVNSYGKNLQKRINFAGLLKKINNISGIQRIRFTTSHPKDLSHELIRCFEEINKLCEHIHLPVQSGSNKILQHMNRGYTREEYIKKIGMLREVKPDISITSDMIVGFPGETDHDFQKTIDLMENVKFDNLFSFKYSERAGTVAADLDNKVNERIKSERLVFLQSLQESHTLEINNTSEGKVMDVLVEGRSKNSSVELMGRTRTNKIVNFKGSPLIKGEIVPVLINKAYQHSFHGELLP
jgi:tRNA-2-methylthio-N6-dimethylallyladenosine synthase